MNTETAGKFRAHWREIIGVFLKLGAMSYGGPAIMGLMQNEVQQKRAWLSKDNFVEGLAFVNMLPGPGATQLGIYLGYMRGGWWGGFAAGLSFILPALFIMLTLTFVYTEYGNLPHARALFYGLSPVVVGIFAIAVYRLGKAAIKDNKQVMLALAGALALGFTPLGIIPGLLLGGAFGVALYGSKAKGIAAILFIAACYVVWHFSSALLPSPATSDNTGSGIWDVGLFFFQVGAFTFGGGLTMLAFMQDQIVNQLHWLSPQQFLDGLALGQLTPGPILMVAAFVGYQVAAIWGALVGATAIFLPSFILMLSLLPMLERVKKIAGMKAAFKGIGPVVIGMIAVALIRMLPAAIPDSLTALLTLATLVVLLAWRRIGPLTLMVSGGVVGLLFGSV